MTALHHVSKKGLDAIADLLLRNGAKVSAGSKVINNVDLIHALDI